MSRRKKWLLFGLLVLVMGLISPVIWFKVRSRRPNILFITLDTTRADRLGPYRYPLAKTPCLDRLAKEGVLFENALTHVPLTLPAHATMLTSLYPPEHGLHVNAMGRLSDEIRTLPEEFSSTHYRKGAFLASFVLDHQFGLDRGFDHFDDDFSGTEASSEAAFGRRRDGKIVIDRALEWLQKDPPKWSWMRKPYFCWIHLYDPHQPYPHAATAGKEFDGRPYDAELSYVDNQLERLLNQLRENGELENTLIVVAGDHGEGLNEHAETNHGQQLYQSTLHVPLIFHWPDRFSGPGFTGPRRVPEAVGLVDLSPTLLDLLGMPPLKRQSGRSILPALQGKPLDPVWYFAETFEPYYELQSAPQRALIEDGWKYVQSTIPELYNLAQDPHELKNLVKVDKEKAERMADLLHEIEAKMVKGKAAETHVSQKTLKWLSDIGYVTGHDLPGDEVFKNLTDIKELLPAFNRATEAVQLRERGNVGDAERLLAQIIKDQPASRPARMFYAETLAQHANSIRDNPQARQQTFEQAVEACESLIQHEKTLKLPDSIQTWEAHLILGGAYSELGREDKAEEAYEAAVKLQPKNSKVLTQVGMGRISKPRLRAQGIQNLEAAVDIDKQLWLVQYVLGGIYTEQGRSNDALDKFRLAAQYNPTEPKIRIAIASNLMSRKKWSEGQQELERALVSIPQHPDLQQLLGVCRQNAAQK